MDVSYRDHYTVSLLSSETDQAVTVFTTPAVSAFIAKPM